MALPRHLLGAGRRVLVLLAAAVACTAGAGELSLRWSTNGAGVIGVTVSGLSESALAALRSPDWNLDSWQRLLQVRVNHGHLFAEIDTPPMVGRYTINRVVAWFEPRFPLDPRIEYRATLDSSSLPSAPGSRISAILPASKTPRPPSTHVTALYPSMDVLPENLLKFYIHFSAPMSRGDVYRQIELREESGQRVELPFLELGEELWNPEQTRLTVILDPGRIKRGLRPLEEEGPALVQGRRYTLFIHKDWLDSEGIPLAADHEKTFLVGGADRTPPDLARWQLRTPAAGTREPLKVEFDEPLDQALALRLLEVHDRSGSRIQGRAALSTNEREWQFVPEADWRRRDYVLSVKKVLEDLAGNNIGKVFDVDLTVADPLHGSPTSLEPTASLRFHPGQ